jgi:hypothetical protein
LGASAVACNDIDLAGETYNDTPAAYDDLGGNRCGCDDGAVCKVLSAGLDVPSPLPTIE